MSTIKDLVDLVTQLDASRFDARTREAVLPIQEAALKVQREQFQSERQHVEEMEKLKAEYRDAMGRFQAEKAALEVRINERPVAKFLPRTGTWLEQSPEIHYCPRCRQNDKWSPMQSLEHGWRCPSCGKFCENPENPVPDIIRNNCTDDDW